MTRREEIAELLERGKHHYRSGAFGTAANDFKRVLEADPDNTEASEFLVLIDEILNFRNTDLLNP